MGTLPDRHLPRVSIRSERRSACNIARQFQNAGLATKFLPTNQESIFGGGQQARTKKGERGNDREKWLRSRRPAGGDQRSMDARCSLPGVADQVVE
jgi:hypothetical protein